MAEIRKTIGKRVWASAEGWIPQGAGFTDPPVPRGTDYASLFVSDVPVVVQHTPLYSRKAAIALTMTLAYGEGLRRGVNDLTTMNGRLTQPV